MCIPDPMYIFNIEVVKSNEIVSSPYTKREGEFIR